MTHDDLNVPGLCFKQRKIFAEIVGPGAFDVRQAAAAYVGAGHNWTNIPRTYQALVRAGKLPYTGCAWKIARIAFREAAKVHPSLAPWAEALGPGNWREAQKAARDAYNHHVAVYNPNAAAIIADAAADAAVTAADDDAYAAAAAAAAIIADADAMDVYIRVRDEIINIVLEEITNASH